MSGVQKLSVPETDDGSRLDRWFKRQFPHIPHGKVEKLLRKGEIRLDGKRAKGKDRIAAGQIVRVPPLPDPSDMSPTPPVGDEDAAFIRSLVIYEDDEMFALNKPPGLAVQGGTKTRRHIDGMLPALGEGCRLIHRLWRFADRQECGSGEMGRARVSKPSR
jgi:23S rRNA pseudouridine955/2504/2580 synthase